jgi:hypothetical protein
LYTLYVVLASVKEKVTIEGGGRATTGRQPRRKVLRGIKKKIRRAVNNGNNWDN